MYQNTTKMDVQNKIWGVLFVLWDARADVRTARFEFDNPRIARADHCAHRHTLHQLSQHILQTMRERRPDRLVLDCAQIGATIWHLNLCSSYTFHNDA